MATSDAKKLDRKIDQFADQLPDWAGRFLRWLRAPSGRWVRIPIAIVLVIAGFIGFLPILGFWMIPLGLLLIAQDVPFLQRPFLLAIEWAERKWKELKRWWKKKRKSK